MKLYAILRFFLVASIIYISYCHKDDSISPKFQNKNLMDTIFLKINGLIGQFKESKELGQQRQKAINYGCVWKICSRPLKTTPQITKEKTVERVMGTKFGYILGGYKIWIFLSNKVNQICELNIETLENCIASWIL